MEPNSRVAEAYKKKSESFLISSRILLENERLEETVSMAYYSMYYMMLALLFKTGIQCENHTGAMLLLHRLYRIDSTRVAAAKKDRVDKQYYIDFDITAAEVSNSVEEAEIFNAELLDYIERLHEGDIRRLREKAREILES
ncbi:HEPN domain-containing protein [Methanocalculus sp.]|uniref:HEPN domain-containing protein n=1 Tax=Methanocalculus sp. TaxID=2004547 RepID=UPI002626DA1D|nr:HEPN domain-containing protein [Methanocalculus sp.]MDG6249276.1 HEPN domain-containing protein [Methanocalculus sp.]